MPWFRHATEPVWRKTPPSDSRAGVEGFYLAQAACPRAHSTSEGSSSEVCDAQPKQSGSGDSRVEGWCSTSNAESGPVAGRFQSRCPRHHGSGHRSPTPSRSAHASPRHHRPPQRVRLGSTRSLGHFPLVRAMLQCLRPPRKLVPSRLGMWSSTRLGATQVTPPRASPITPRGGKGWTLPSGRSFSIRLGRLRAPRPRQYRTTLKSRVMQNSRRITRPLCNRSRRTTASCPPPSPTARRKTIAFERNGIARGKSSRTPRKKLRCTTVAWSTRTRSWTQSQRGPRGISNGTTAEGASRQHNPGTPSVGFNADSTVEPRRFETRAQGRFVQGFPGKGREESEVEVACSGVPASPAASSPPVTFICGSCLAPRTRITRGACLVCMPPLCYSRCGSCRTTCRSR